MNEARRYGIAGVLALMPTSHPAVPVVQDLLTKAGGDVPKSYRRDKPLEELAGVQEALHAISAAGYLSGNAATLCLEIFSRMDDATYAAARAKFEWLPPCEKRDGKSQAGPEKLQALREADTGG